NLYGIFTGFLKNPKKNLVELEKTLRDGFIQTIETTLREKECVKSDFKQTERAEVIKFIVKNIIIILEKQLNNKEWRHEDAHQEIPLGMKNHLSDRYIKDLMNRILEDIAKVLNEVKPFLPVDSILSCS